MRNLKKKYNRFINIFNERGITLNIVNKDYGLKEWDNLYFKRQGRYRCYYYKVWYCS